MSLQTTLKTDFPGSGRFGTSFGKIGDINGDGFADLAISSPFERNGAVYVYLGRFDGVAEKPVQKVLAPETSLGEISVMGFFGFSISGGADVDSNGYPDIAIGSPNSEHVFIYKVYPFITIDATMKSSAKKLPVSNSAVVVDICSRFINNRNFTNSICKSQT